MRRQHVSSSAISSVGYDERRSVLEVEFASGSVYDYFEVPPEVWEELLAAPSKGRFVSSRVRGQFESEKR